MSDHIEPSHMDSPIRNVAGAGVSKRSADSYEEMIKENIEVKRQREKSEEKDKRKSKKEQKDVYEREFVNTSEHQEETVPKDKKDPESPGFVIDVTA